MAVTPTADDDIARFELRTQVVLLRHDVDQIREDVKCLKQRQGEVQDTMKITKAIVKVAGIVSGILWAFFQFSGEITTALRSWIVQ